MPWFKGLWFDHVVSDETDVKTFNAAMEGSAMEFPPSLETGPEAPPAEPEAPPAEPEAPPAEPSEPEAPAPPVDDPTASLEAAHDKAGLVAMAKTLGIDTKGMNKSQIAQAIVAATPSADPV